MKLGIALFAGFGWLSLLCIVAGIVLVIIEMLQPGIGAPGIIGALLLIAGVILYAQNPLQALIMVMVILAILGAALVLILYSASKGRLYRRIVLHDSIEDDTEFSAVEDLNYFVGSEGRALTVLRPSGTADFNGVKLDVVSEGEYIPKDAIIVITKVERNRIVVRRKNSD